ncbi:unnamed protein product [Callosobruchus maculatus]|uniref:Uncharacterized protein n=1 Tax=Callosobruchus maculatus TaxID=64391 RepID=A0A653CLC6_CALMS|nr:unnamed protein product [Callosobruchus maculatus]
MATVPSTIVVFTEDKKICSGCNKAVVSVSTVIFLYGVREVIARGDKIYISLTYSPRAKTVKRKFENLPVKYMRAKIYKEDEFKILQSVVKRYKLNLLSGELEDMERNRNESSAPIPESGTKRKKRYLELPPSCENVKNIYSSSSDDDDDDDEEDEDDTAKQIKLTERDKEKEKFGVRSNREISEMQILPKAAAIIRSGMTSFEPKDGFPSPDGINTREFQSEVPHILLVFVSWLIDAKLYAKAENEQTNELATIQGNIILGLFNKSHRKNSFHVGLGLHLYHHIPSKHILDTLSKLGLICSYNDVRQIATSLAKQEIDDNEELYVPKCLEQVTAEK